MSEVLVIARREIEEKKFVFVAALAFAALAVAISFLPGARSHQGEVIATASIFLAAAFALGLASIFGVTIVGRDIAAGRMSFYFARPVSAVSIWFGKLLAVAVMVVVTFAIVTVPAAIAGFRMVRSLFTNQIGFTLAIVAGLAVAQLIVTHAIGTMLRSRSPLIAIDFLAAVATAFLGWLMLRPLLDGYAIEAAKVLAWVAGSFFVIAFLAAGAWQLADGRTDRRRSHAAFSKAFWAVIAVLLVFAGGFTGWIVSATPADLAKAYYAESSGETALLGGLAAHRFDYRPLFLYDVATGRSERIGGSGRWQARLSRDGSHMIAIDFDRVRPPHDAGELYVRDTKPGSRAVGTSIVVSGRDAFAVSDDGSRLAVVHGGVLSVSDLARRQSLGSVRVTGHTVGWLFFVSPNLVRMIVSDDVTHPPTAVPRQLVAMDYDVATHALVRGGGTNLTARLLHMVAKPDGSQLIVYGDTNGPRLCDGRTLQTIAVLPAHRAAAFLRDGRIALAVADRAAHRASLLVATADGHVTSTIDLGKADWAFGVREVAPGTVIVTAGDNAGWRTSTIDLASNKVVRTADLRSSTSYFGFRDDPRQPNIGPTSLMIDAKNGVPVRWNALTGERKPL